MTRRVGAAWWAAAGLALAFLGWTVLVVTGVLPPADRAVANPGLVPGSAAAQIFAALAITFWPGVVTAALWLLAWWERGHRMKQLSLALLVGPAIAWVGTILLKRVLVRERPTSTMPDLITSTGWSYPSSHAALMVTGSILVMAAIIVSRQRKRVVTAAGALVGLATVVVLADRFVLAASWFSDLVGGALWGGMAACLALALAKVHVLDEVVTGGPVETGRGKRAAIIYNPAKVGDVDTFRRHVTFELDARGWEDPMWLATTTDDPGYGMVSTAVDKDVDLVLVAGGDGTVNIVCAGLARTGIPVGLLPAGTTNLLARNLGVPLDEHAAIQTALEGRRRPIDLIRVVPDGDRSEARYSAVIASVGLDADAFANTSEDMKKAIGHAAYFVAAAQQLGGDGFRPLTCRVTMDDGHSVEREAALVAIGNVGFIQGGIEVIPGASPDDGQLNVAVAAPDTLASWARMLTEVLAKKSERADIDQLVGRRVRVELAEPHPWQLDGDVAGEARVLEASCLPHALHVMVPRQA